MFKKSTSLLNAKAGVPLFIEDIDVAPNVLHRLNALGIIKGVTIELIEKRGNLVAVRCFGSKYALGSSVTKYIFVSEIQLQTDKNDQQNHIDQQNQYFLKDKTDYNYEKE